MLVIIRCRVFENMLFGRIFGLKRDEVTGNWRRLHKEKLYDLYSSPNIIRVIKSARWAGHVALWKAGEVRMRFWWGGLREGDHL
jgi:hypothetical protein